MTAPQLNPDAAVQVRCPRCGAERFARWSDCPDGSTLCDRCKAEAGAEQLRSQLHDILRRLESAGGQLAAGLRDRNIRKADEGLRTLRQQTARLRGLCA